MRRDGLRLVDGDLQKEVPGLANNSVQLNPFKLNAPSAVDDIAFVKSVIDIMFAQPSVYVGQSAVDGEKRFNFTRPVLLVRINLAASTASGDD